MSNEKLPRKVLSIRIKEKNIERLRVKAKTHHMSMSNYARKLIREDLKNISKLSSSELANLKEDREELIKLLDFLNEMFINYSDYLAENEEMMNFIIKNETKFSRITEIIEGV